MPDIPSTYSILGAARSGLAVAALLRAEGATVFVSDSRPADAEASIEAMRRLDAIGAGHEFGGHTDRVLKSATLVLSPGVPDTIPIVRRALENGMALTNEIEIAWKHCRGRVVAITGTNGKTTTTELAGHIFRTAGWKTFVAGNVGIPFSEVAPLTDEESVVVLEVSSFQLEHIATFKPRVAVLLNITPDHMDRYATFADYAEAKYRITMNQDAGDALIYNADDASLAGLPSRSGARSFGFSIQRELPAGAFQRDGGVVIRMESSEISHNEEALMPVDAIRIRGPHNLYNSMAAALSARELGVDAGAIREGLETFPGVAHRLEPVRELDGVRWVNDSKATNVDSMWYALSSFPGSIILIAGGKSKKNVYDSVLPLIAERVKAAILIGDAAAEMEEAFGSITKIYRAGHSMENAIATAQSIAEPGDVVLLSPACASFDMFNNYEHRGDHFKSLVGSLASMAGMRQGSQGER